MRDNKGSSKRMRVTIQHADGKGITMKIEGKIAGPAVPVLHQAWQDLTPSLRQKELLVDLRGVTHVDGTGRKLLAEIHDATRAGFLADTPLTKYFAEEAQRGIGTKSKESY
jgi:ABC-type transporter Mla MlaB component